MGNFTKELVNAFNLNNYFSDEINANFTVEGKKIVGLFASGTNIGEYLRRIGEEIIERHYLSGTEVAGAFYNLNCFPFVLGANPDKEYLGNGIVKVKLADSTDPAVIHNLKINFASEFERAVISKVVARLQKAGITKKEAYEWIKGTVGTGAIGKPYLYCIAFSDEYLDDSETFEMVKEMYIQEFNSRLEACGLKSSDFYEYKDDMLYIKDVSDKVVRSVAKYVKGRVALDFRTPGSIESKVENCKNVLSELIYQSIGKYVEGYDYDDFIDENKIKNGHSFALVPYEIVGDGQFETLSFNDARNIYRTFNEKINKAVLNGFIPKNYDIISDIRGKTANPQFANCKEPVYAFSNKQIALLLPMIMQSPIAYNQINGRFEFAVDLENFKRRGSSRSSSTVSSPFNSPTHAGPSGLRTPPNQRKKDTDSGYDSNSPPKPKDSGAQSSSGGPRSLFEQPQTQKRPTRSPDGALEEPPRPELEESFMLHKTLDVPGTSGGPLTRLGCSTVSRGVAGPSSSSQSVGAAQNRWLLQDTSENKWIPQVQFAEPGPGDLSWTQSEPSSSKGADGSMLTGSSVWYVPLPISPLTTRNDPTSRSPGVEDVNGVEPEEQQVSDECSEAKSQKSKSPKEYGGGFKSKIKSFFSLNSKPKQHEASLKRYDVGRDTTRSMPTISVTKKPPLPERSASERKAKSNPPSGVTSPTHEGAPGGLKPLTSDERKELRPLLSPELQEKLDSHSLSPGEERHLYLTHTLSGKWEIKKSFESQEENLRRSANAQLPYLDSKKGNRDSGFGSMGSPAPSKVTECSVQQVERMLGDLGK